MSPVASSPKPASTKEKFVEVAWFAGAAWVVNAIPFLGVLLYGLARSETVRVPYFMDVIVHESGGFEVVAHYALLWSLLLTTVALLGVQMLRLVRR